jgi:hypothetical protein
MIELDSVVYNDVDSFVQVEQSFDDSYLFLILVCRLVPRCLKYTHDD